MYSKLLIEKPWAKKVGDAVVANTMPQWELSLNPKNNWKVKKVQLRYGLGSIEFPFQSKEKAEILSEETPSAFEKFDTYGMAEFEGNGTIEVNITLVVCRIKTFFFLPIHPDTRDTVCYNMVGGFTTNKSGEFVPFQVVGYAFRRISP